MTKKVAEFSYISIVCKVSTHRIKLPLVNIHQQIYCSLQNQRVPSQTNTIKNIANVTYGLHLYRKEGWERDIDTDYNLPL